MIDLLTIPIVFFMVTCFVPLCLFIFYFVHISDIFHGLILSWCLVHFCFLQMLSNCKVYFQILNTRDILLFFLMWELELIPVYLLLSLWGGKKRCKKRCFWDMFGFRS
ncbi:hypothetical protein KP509_27G031000 [Ceratopteris richardii]|uniref:Uncharacterized protein n=1 Tax=Ceratopteris richardii TaxID=49495 RepID=A0A8T2RGI3_CERRI|nr:hypothetical protein KP509_27G031000 [Ceratopteris richardii]